VHHRLTQQNHSLWETGTRRARKFQFQGIQIMKREVAVSLCAAVATLAFACAQSAQAQDNSNPQSNSQWTTSQSDNSVDSAEARQEAQQMVPARVTLLNEVSTRKSHEGDQVRAEVRSRDVVLKDGTKLPSGTVLVGKITEAQASPGNVRLAMRFNDARLKDGQTVPVKATIVAIEPPGDEVDGIQQAQVPAHDVWNQNTLQVDELGAVGGADLHSSIAGDNSGVIVSDRKDSIKITAGSQIDLAIGPSMNQQIGSAPAM
jgi:hypothetical protein